MSGARLALAQLACRRGGRLLFTRLDLTLSAGQCALVTGPNGIGKSSLLRLVAGLLTPFAGAVERVGTLALADEAHALDTERTLTRALGFWAALDGAAPDRIAAALAALDLGHLADIPVRMLSTGQRKRAALARTLISDADIWLLDEPANGLDSASAQRLGALVEQHRAGGGIVLAASHLPLHWAHDHQVTLRPPAEDPGDDFSLDSGGASDGGTGAP